MADVVHCVLSVYRLTMECTADEETQPVWGQEFFFDFNPLGTLQIALTNEQFLMSEELGRIEITVSSILDGLQRAEGQAISPICLLHATLSKPLLIFHRAGPKDLGDLLPASKQRAQLRALQAR